MLDSWRNRSELTKEKRKDESWLSLSLKPENFVPGLLVGFLLGFLMDMARIPVNSKRVPMPTGKKQSFSFISNEDLKMVLVVRQDLKMGPGKIASQCAHAATGIYAEIMQSQRTLLSQWEQCGQPKIVVTCKNQQEMNKLKEAANSIGLPTFVVADAGRTEVAAGSKTVLAIGPGRKSMVDSVTGKLRLL